MFIYLIAMWHLNMRISYFTAKLTATLFKGTDLSEIPPGHSLVTFRSDRLVIA